MNLKEDISSWVKNYLKSKIIKNNINQFSKNNAEICSEREYWDNYIKTLYFEKKAEEAKKSDFGDLNKQAFENRSTSCFYCDPNGRYSLQKCVNVQNDGFIIRDCCSHCSHFSTIQDYSLLAKELVNINKKKQQSADNLLSGLMFWKHKNR
ncbi:MAG: hypothetical protein IJL05_03170 [Alphaproteobacteria bacterium]|nr:hypothetical protein [Alphaproteobacteria bacterium]